MEADTKESKVQGHLWLQSKFCAALDRLLSQKGCGEQSVSITAWEGIDYNVGEYRAEGTYMNTDASLEWDTQDFFPSQTYYLKHVNYV